MASLVGQQLKDTYDSLLKTTDNDALSGTYKEITDGSGNGSNLYLGTGGNVGIGTSSIDGILHLDGGTSSDLVIEKDGGGGASVRFHNDGSQLSYIQLDTSEDMIHYGASGVNQIIYAGGAERLRIASDGNIGINETNPDYPLHIKAGTNILKLETTSDGRTQLGGYDSSDNTIFLVGSPDSTNAEFWNYKNGYLRFATNSTERMRITSDGDIEMPLATNAVGRFVDNVGEVGSGNFCLQVANSANDALKPLGFRAEKFLFATGNVGIGVTPDHPLHVRGASTANTDVTYAKFDAGATSQPSLSIGGNNKSSSGERYAWIQAEQSDGTPDQHLILNKDGGNVGIGTTSPDTKLHVEGVKNTSILRLTSTTNDASWTTGDKIGGIEFESRDGSGAGAGVKGSINYIVQGSTGSTTAMTFSTASGSSNDVERMRIDSSGDIGIGGTPASISSTARWLTLNADNGSSASGGIIHQIDGTTKGAQYVFGSNVYHDAKSGIGHQFAVDNGTVAMTMNTNGRIGIGTTSASGILHVKGDTNDNGAELFLQVNNNNTTDNIGAIHFGNNADTTLSTILSGTSGANNSSYLTFSTSATGTLNEAMRIDSSGDLLIGTTSNVSETQGGAEFLAGESGGRSILRLSTTNTTANDLVVFFNGNGVVGRISTSGSSTSYQTSSDYRLKENVVEMTGALDRIDQLKPSRFNFIADADTTVDGFLAHEVADVVPEAITGEKDAVDEEGNPIYQGIDQSKLVPLLVGAIQELRAEIEQLKNQ